MRYFVRAMDQLAEYSPKATGLTYTEPVAREIFGDVIVDKVIEEGAALISSGPRAIGASFKKERLAQGLSTQELAELADISESIVIDTENFARTPIRQLIKIAKALNMSELDGYKY